MKRYLKEPNTRFTLTAVKILTERFKKITTVEWKKNVEHINIWEARDVQDQWFEGFYI